MCHIYIYISLFIIQRIPRVSCSELVECHMYSQQERKYKVNLSCGMRSCLGADTEEYSLIISWLCLLFHLLSPLLLLIHFLPLCDYTCVLPVPAVFVLWTPPLSQLSPSFLFLLFVTISPVSFVSEPCTLFLCVRA